MKSLRGQLLIASPQMRDPNFAQTVLFIVQHDEDGALGLVLNRPTQTTIRDAWEQLNEESCTCEQPLYQGGPCPGPLMALHTSDGDAEVELLGGICFSAEASSVGALVGREESPIKYFLGYAGWSPGQLEKELGEGSWLTTEAAPELVFSDDTRQWKFLVRSLTAPPGVRRDRIPEDPSVN